MCVCAQLCLPFCSPLDCNLPGSSVHGIFQTRLQEWVAISSSEGSSQLRDQTCISYVSCIGRRPLCHLGRGIRSGGSVQFSHSVVSDSVTPWTAAGQVSLSITNSQSLLKPTSIESVMPSNHLILYHPPSPPAPNPSQHQSLFQWVNSSHEVAKVLEFQL